MVRIPKTLSQIDGSAASNLAHGKHLLRQFYGFPHMAHPPYPPACRPPKMQLSDRILLDSHMHTGGPAQAFLETSRHEADGPPPLGRRYACLCHVEPIELKDDACTDE